MNNSSGQKLTSGNFRSTSTRPFWEANPCIGQSTQLGWSSLPFAELLAPHISGKRVLDIGCGGGALSSFLAKHGATVVGLDFSPTLIDMAKSNFGQTDKLKFVEANVLNVDLGEQFDIICGRAILHEIPYADTPRLLQFFDRHLEADGFGWFQENSFFNFGFRFVRNHLVGRHGIPKLGSEHETPFDKQRFELYTHHFKYCTRSAEVFVLFTMIHIYLIRSQRARNAFTKLDMLISNLGVPDVITRNLSYWQHIYFSNAHPKDRALGVKNV